MKKTFQLCALFLATLVATGTPAAAESYPYDQYDEYDEASYATDDDGLDGSYSYVRVVEGSATLTQGDTGDRDEARLHQPVLVGDRLWVAPDSRMEIVLSDYNRLRMDEGTEVVFDRLAGSPDGTDAETALRLLSGNLQVVVTEGHLGTESPRLELPFATVYTRSAGSYRVECDRYGVCWVVVRDGSAEVLTDRGSLLVRTGETAYLEQRGDLPQVSIETAKSWDNLERWGERLDLEARRAELRGVDESLRYTAAPLDDHGDWVGVDDGYAWRPRGTSHDWRPYWRGSWRYTPSGLFWISDEPWGWVTHHYGSWDLHPHYGWVWYPSNVFAPARVYWYWGPSHVAWVPAGYYTRHYKPRYSSFGFRFGVFGYAGGSYHHYRDWVFCDLSYFRRHHHRRDFHHHLRHGHALERVHRGDVVPRGIITTDTRGLRPDRWDDPQRALRDWADRRNARRTAVPRLGDRGGDVLPDVTPFVARQPDLPEPIRRRVATTRTPDRPLRDATRTPDATPDRQRPTRVTVRPRTPETTTRQPAVTDRPTRVDRTERPVRTERPTASDRPTRTRRPTTTRTTPPSRTTTPRTVRPRTVEPWARDRGGDERELRRPAPSARPDRPAATRQPASPQRRPSVTERPVRRPAPSRPSASSSPSPRRPSASDRPTRTERPTTSTRAPVRRPTTSARPPARTPTSVRTPRTTRPSTSTRAPSSRSKRPSTSTSRPLRRPSAGSSSSSSRGKSSARPSRSSGSKKSSAGSSGRSSRSQRSTGSRSGSGSRGKSKARPRRNNGS